MTLEVPAMAAVEQPDGWHVLWTAMYGGGEAAFRTFETAGGGECMDRRLRPGRKGEHVRRSQLRRMSEKRKQEKPDRDRVTAKTLKRAGYRCEMAPLVPEVECTGGLDIDEIVPRGVYPGGHLDDSNTQAGCRAHHRWKTDHDAEAHRRGLRLWSWERAEGAPREVAARMQAEFLAAR